MKEMEASHRNTIGADCRQFHAGLADYLEGDAHLGIERHAAQCPACAALLADLQLLRREAAQLPLEEPPASLWMSLQARLAAERASALGPACREFQAALADFLEGEARPAVTRHAGECVFCSTLLTDLQVLRREAAQLPLQEPPARLWANVRAQMAAEGLFREPAGGWTRWLRMPGWPAVAAPVGALACLVLFGLALLVPPGAVDRNSAWLSTADRAQAAQQVIATEDSALVSTINELQQSYEQQQGQLAPTIRATYQKGLASLDDSIRQCRASVEREPANQLARQLLINAYSRKAEVLASALNYDVPHGGL